ncbi:MAG: insulinase family protein [Clostridia bacterium]|nr:insulinase family protein [Clostridia bacterium]
MDNIEQIKLFEGGKLLCVQTGRFMTSRITFRFVLPLDADTVSAYAALPGLIRYTSRHYPATLQMERKLASLYGAGFSAVAGKAGDMQILSFTLSTIADRFAFQGDAVSEAGLRFISECIFEPDLDENGLFKSENLVREKRLMMEDIKTAFGDKMQYSLNRFNEVFYEGERAAVLSSGTVEQVESLEPAAVSAAWKRMLQSAEVLVCAVGDWDAKALARSIRERFKPIQRMWKKETIQPHPAFKALKEVHESETLEQCKLNMGFSLSGADEDAFKVMNMIFGRSEMSRLSKVVREKMGLCYYCSSSYGPKKQIIIVYSGIEPGNRQKTVEAVMEQLKAIQAGDFSDEETEIAKRKLKDAYLSSMDSPADIAGWYLPQMLTEDTAKSVHESIENIMRVDRQRIIDCAKTVKLDCIYTLGDNA